MSYDQWKTTEPDYDAIEFVDERLAEATVQELLEERRENVIERERETDETARAMLEAHVDEIDRELARRRNY